MATATRTASTDPLEAILNRWIPWVAAARRCECDACTAERAAGVFCSECSYKGEPYVWACECPERYGEARHAAGADECGTCHGSSECPVCIDGDAANDGLTEHLLGMVRDLRTALRSQRAA